MIGSRLSRGDTISTSTTALSPFPPIGGIGFGGVGGVMGAAVHAPGERGFGDRMITSAEHGPGGVMGCHISRYPGRLENSGSSLRFGLVESSLFCDSERGPKARELSLALSGRVARVAEGLLAASSLLSPCDLDEPKPLERGVLERGPVSLDRGPVPLMRGQAISATSKSMSNCGRGGAGAIGVQGSGDIGRMCEDVCRDKLSTSCDEQGSPSSALPSSTVSSTNSAPTTAQSDEMDILNVSSCFARLSTWSENPINVELS
mmetsp:Transcript_26135/g.56589  ORF Transcript_26135/g.56589 Transcript_26135/m.56589 type:complete len:261 (+) Transcript_26135:124-906(+)